MHAFFVLLTREIQSYFRVPIGYVVMFFFLLITGFNFWFGVTLLNGQMSEVTVAEAFFNTAIFWIGYILVFPLITMRLFSEEFKMGTIEPLMTAPVTDAAVVAAKFCGAMVFYLLLWVPSFLYFLTFQWVANEPAALSGGAYFGSYLLLVLMGMFFVALGCLASVLTSNQIIAAIISFCTITLFFFTGLLGFLFSGSHESIREVTNYFSALVHMLEFSRGQIDTRPVVFYLSMSALILFVTFQIFQARRWKA